MGLEEYEAKRDFDKTDEPRSGSDGDGDRFVIQKHDASSLHYDFRLETDGVMKSWSVPKGPSTDPSERRLAIRTEDHPIDYADFEGVIPEDEYGGGTVLVWDRGTYDNIKEPDEEGNQPTIAEQLESGQVAVALHGEKIHGGYELVHMEEDRWLLVKHDDDEADARRNPTSTEPESVLSGRDLEEVREEESDNDE